MNGSGSDELEPSGGPMSVEPRHTGEDLPLHSTWQIDAVGDEIEASLKLAGGVAIEPYLGRVEGPGCSCSSQNLRYSLWVSCRGRCSGPPAVLLKANPTLHEELRSLPQSAEGTTTAPLSDDSSRLEKPSVLMVRYPDCHCSIEMIVDASVDIGCPSCGGSFTESTKRNILATQPHSQELRTSSWMNVSEWASSEPSGNRATQSCTGRLH